VPVIRPLAPPGRGVGERGGFFVEPRLYARPGCPRRSTVRGAPPSDRCEGAAPTSCGCFAVEGGAGVPFAGDRAGGCFWLFIRKVLSALWAGCLIRHPLMELLATRLSPQAGKSLVIPNPHTRKGYAGGYPAASQRPFRSPSRGRGCFCRSLVIPGAKHRIY